MNCANELKEWVIYDAKQGVFHKLSHEEIKVFVNARPEFSPIKWKDVKIWSREESKKIWIDGMINAEDFK